MNIVEIIAFLLLATFAVAFFVLAMSKFEKIKHFPKFTHNSKAIYPVSINQIEPTSNQISILAIESLILNDNNGFGLA